MSRSLIASKLIKSVRNRAMIPDDDAVYNDEAILEILNEEIDVGLLDTLLTLHEDHLVTYTDKPYKLVADGTKRLIVPQRAIGCKLKDIQCKIGNSYFELGRIDLGEISDYSMYPFSNIYGGDLFYMEGDEIVILSPRATQSNLFRMYYHLKPNSIVEESDCAQISSIDRTTGVIQFSSIPKNFVDMQFVDFIQNASANKILAFDIAVTNVSVSTRTLTVDPELIPDRLVIGDWVCFPETSPYPNVPTELHPVLAQRAACYILEAVGDAEQLATAERKLKKIEKSVQKLLDNRVDNANRKIKSRHGFLQNKMNSRRRVSRGRF